MNTPLVTIAIPIYNAEKYLRDAIQSCINQTYQNWELLLMCDGSTDKSSSIAFEMANNDCRIKVVDDSTNKGMIYRLNQSIQMAKGKYYARMDADDIMSINRIEKEVEYLENHKDVDVVGSSMMIIDGENNIVDDCLKKNDEIFVHPSVMGKIEWFLKNNYDETSLRAEDFDLWNRTASFSTFRNIEVPLIFYRAFGMPTTKKMLTSYHIKRKLYFRYRSYNKSIFWAIKGFTAELLKSIILILLSSIGLQKIITYARKYRRLPETYRLSIEDLKCSIIQNENFKRI